MKLRDSFCALILTHGRPDNVKTLRSMERAGYSGPWFLLVDDEDPTLEDYIRTHGEEHVVVFSKELAAQEFDEGDNFPDRRCIVYARNAAFRVARELGFSWFIQLDDDYTQFYHRFDGQLRFDSSTTNACNLDQTWELMCQFLESCPPSVVTVAMGQGGDYLGGQDSPLVEAVKTKRKAMNSFVCSTERPFQFGGKLNEDVNIYTEEQRRGQVVLTLLQVALIQTTTQANAGGMSDIYASQGTYVKSFYTVMRCPSAVRIAVMNSRHPRIHHQVSWDEVAPKILREHHRK